MSDPSPSLRSTLERWPSLVFAGFLGLAFSATLPAQESDSSPADEPASEAQAEERSEQEFTEEIVVTARRKAENLQQIPVSVTAFSQSTLEQRSATRLIDLAEMTPNLTIGVGSFGNDTSEAAVFIRGVGQGDTAIFSDPGVGIYIDGIFLARAQGAILDLVDLERVEVLRGPQGTLFGKNTSGGAIQLITRRPAREFQAELGLTLGNYDRLNGNVLVDGALGDSLFGSLSYHTANSDGWSRSLVTGQEFHDDGRDLLRASLEWAPERGLQAYVSADWVSDQSAGGNQGIVAFESTPLIDFYNTVRGDQGFSVYDERFISSDFYETSAGQTTFGPSEVDGEIFGTTLDLSYARGDWVLHSLTGYRDVDYLTIGDSDGSPVPLAEVRSNERQDQISQEFQIQGTTDKADWTIGAIYFRETPESDDTQYVLGGLYEALELAPGPIYAPPGVPDFLCSPGPPPPGLPCFGGAGNLNNFGFFLGDGLDFDLDLETESWAIFGESTWRLTDRLSFTLGGRWTEDDKSFRYVQYNGFGLVDHDLFAEDTWSDWSGRASLAFQASDDVLFYGTLSRGFKSGGFNGRPQDRGVLDTFEPEAVEALEIGLKSDLLDRRLRFNVAAFASDYTDIHFAASLSSPSGQPVFVTQNAGEAEIRGFELETEFHPALGWVVASTLGYLDTELIALNPTVPAGVDPGNELPRSPEWAASLGLQKSTVIGDDASLIARVDYTWSDDVYNDLANTPAILQEAYSLLSARITYGPFTDRWELSLWGTNLTDEEYIASGFIATAFGPSLYVAAPPAQYGASITLRF